MATKVRKVVDTNQLRDSDLRNYLARSTSNFAVLTDYTMMEAYKGETFSNFFSSMEILIDFPDQVIALKNTGRVCGLSGRRAGLQRRLIDAGPTREFPTFCEDIKAAQTGDLARQAVILEHGQAANEHIDQTLLQVSTGLLKKMEAMAQATFSKDELRMLRGPAFRLDVTMARKLLTSIFWTACNLLQYRPGRRWLPRDFARFQNTFQLRFALCMHTLILEWLATGGGTETKPSKVRNDMVDVVISAYATYFDGLLSKDAKAMAVYDHAMAILSTVLVSPPPAIVEAWHDVVEDFDQ